MLLLTSLAFGGADSVAAYEHLDQAEEELLKHRAASLLQIPREKRIPLLVQEIKRLVTQRRRHLSSADPKRLAALLKKERPSMVEVVLSGLGAELAEAVRAELGTVPAVKLRREVKADVLSIVRWKLDDAMRSSTPQVGSFRFTDLITMQQREIFAVADRMGARVLATAVAGLSADDRAKFLAELPPDQRILASRSAQAGEARRLSENDAKRLLEMHDAVENPSQGMRSAGVQRIMRACYAQSADFATSFAQRHHGELGPLLLKWLREEKTRPVKGDGGRLDIVEQLERLAQKGIIDRPLRLHPMKPSAAVAQPRGPLSSTANPSSRVLVPPPTRKPTGGSLSPGVPTDPKRPKKH